MLAKSVVSKKSQADEESYVSVCGIVNFCNELESGMYAVA